MHVPQRNRRSLILATMVVPAGIPFLIRSAFILSIPPAFVYCALYALRVLAEITIPVWAQAIAYTVSIPLYFFINIKLRRWRIETDAARNGAALAPTWEGKEFGNLDVMKAFMYGLQEGFLGACIL